MTPEGEELPDLEALNLRFDSASRAVIDLAGAHKRILVVTHIDADGLCSGSIVFSSLMRAGANVAIRCVPDLDRKTIEGLAAQNYDFYIITDLGSTLVGELQAALGGKFVVIDHHLIPEEDAGNTSVINAWNFGYDGGRDACSSSMAFYFAKAVDRSNRDLSVLAVVGAVADRQDTHEGRSLGGLNRAAMEEAQSAGLLTLSSDLLFTGRETRPIHEALALTSSPFLKGITGSRDAALAVLHESGLRLKEGSTWRTISSLSKEEKMKLTEVITAMLASSGASAESVTEFVGEVYRLESEDPFTPLRDAREFATFLNACGRMGVPGTGVAVCLGDRSESLKSAIQTLAEYRLGINKALQALTEDPARTVTRGSFALVRGEGVVDERLLGPVISILTSSQDLSDKVVVGFATSGEAELKVSSRVGDGHAEEVNLGAIMRTAGEAVGGTGGGHEMAAGAKIPASEVKKFTQLVEERLQSEG